MPTCRSCGGEAGDGLRVCERCASRVIDDSGVATPDRGPRWRPPEHTVRPQPLRTYSRWRAGPISHGVVGRTGWTALILLVGYAAYDQVLVLQNPAIVVATLGCYAVAAVPLLVVVWRKQRVR